MNSADKLQILLRSLPSNYMILVDNQIVELDSAGMWLTVVKDYIYYDMICYADFSDGRDDFIATINVHGSIYQVKIVEMIPQTKMAELLKNISEL